MDPEDWERDMARIVHESVDGREIRISVGGTEMVVEVASGDDSRREGLSNRDSIPFDGMLFMYANDSSAPFHRTLMRFDIAIRFYDETGMLLHEDLGAHRADCPVPYRFVLETELDRPVAGKLSVHGF